MMFWSGNQFVIENYLSGGQSATEAILADALGRLRGFLPLSRIVSELRPFGIDPTVVRRMIRKNILVEEGTALDARERLVEGWAWGQNARYFHFSTQEFDYTVDPKKARKWLVSKARRHPPPSPFKAYGGAMLRLPGGFSSRAGGLWEALLARRTARSFERVPISMESLATVLLWTWGKTRYYDRPRAFRCIYKTSPSGGARHPIEVYPVVQRVEGVKPGIYHYSVEHHGLNMIRPGLFENKMVELFSGQEWVRDASVLFFMTACLERSMWKYPFSRAYRVLLFDAGHLSQTCSLVSTSLELGVFVTAALQDRSIEKELGIDGVQEAALYGIAVGRAK